MHPCAPCLSSPTVATGEESGAQLAGWSNGLFDLVGWWADGLLCIFALSFALALRGIDLTCAGYIFWLLWTAARFLCGGGSGWNCTVYVSAAP